MWSEVKEVGYRRLRRREKIRENSREKSRQKRRRKSWENSRDKNLKARQKSRRKKSSTKLPWHLLGYLGITWRKKFLRWKKYISFMAYNAEKNNLTPLYLRKKILSPEVWEKKFLPKPNHPSPTNVKWSADCWSWVLCHFNRLFPLDLQNEIQLLSRSSVIHGWFVYWVFGWEMRHLSKKEVGNYRFQKLAYSL